MRVLITGGAGFIGSITARSLLKAGHEVVIFDSLEHGHKQAVEGLELIIGETQDFKFLNNVLRDKKIEAVIHFAAYIEIGESYQDPYKYFYNNVYGSLQLFKAMVKNRVNNLVFSSTAGVYGNPKKLPIKEDDNKEPENPYGESKLMVEKMINWFDQSHGLKSVSLRYFNAAGASLDTALGEDHHPESHLIPNLIKAVLDQDQPFVLHGDDYDTKDGTCIRDYIHVLDLASAHILALESLVKKAKSQVYNVGTGQGYSNKQVIEMVKKVSEKDINIEIGPKRLGDASILVADAGKIKTSLGWQPKYSDLETIVSTAFKWHQSHPQGYDH